MSSDRRLFRGRRITQAELETNLQTIIVGQSFFARVSLTILISVLSMGSGALAGILGGYISVHAVFPKMADTRLTAVWVAFAIGVWMYSTLRKGLVKGLQRTILATAVTIPLGVMIVTIGRLDATIINAALFFIALALTLTFLSLIGAGLATTLISVLFAQTQKILQAGFTTSVIGAAVLFANLLIHSIGQEVAAIPNEATAQGLSVAVGLVFGGGLVASVMASHLDSRGTTNPMSFIRQWAIAFSTWGRTSFYNLDLSNVDFTGAQLANTDLRARALYRTCFKDVEGLERAWVDNSYLDLENAKVQHLLVRSRSENKDFRGLNLSGACLKDAVLEEFDFTGTNLNGTDLRGANLRGAILVKAQLLGADLSGACLTDVCIQDWNINQTTCFSGVKCERVYIKQTLQGHFLEPKPDSGTFRPGEFEKWLADIQDTVDLIFQNGLNWRAFAFSLAQTAINHDALGLSVRTIENKGDGVVVAKLAVSPEVSKGKIHQEIMTLYPEAVKAIEAKYELVLQAQEGEIHRLNHQFKEFYESQQQFVEGLVSSIAEAKGNVLIQGKGNRVYMIDRAGNIMENVEKNISAGGNLDLSSGSRISIGGDVVGSNVALAERNSQVTSSIQQLRDVKASDSDELAKILSTLQESISSAPVLSDAQKKDALDALETLAEEGKKPPEKRTTKFCSMAVNALKGLIATVSNASQLAETFNTCLPALTALLHL